MPYIAFTPVSQTSPVSHLGVLILHIMPAHIYERKLTLGSLAIWDNVHMGAVGRKIRTALTLLVAPLPYNYCITSGKDGNHGPPSGSYHYGVLDYEGSEAAALDVGCFNSKPDRSARARALAKVIYEQHHDLVVELIVSDVGSGLNSAGGYYIKNQRKVDPYSVDDHKDHIHLATSEALVNRLISRLSRNTLVFTDLDLTWPS